MANVKEITDLHFYDQTGRWKFFKKGEKLWRAKALVRAGWEKRKPLRRAETKCHPSLLPKDTVPLLRS